MESVDKLQPWLEASSSASGANRTLIQYRSEIPHGRVLDVGMGRGDNALWFARQGYLVEGIELCQKAIEAVGREAEIQGVHVETRLADLRDLTLYRRRYSLIIASMVLHFFETPVIERFIQMAKEGLKTGGFIFVSVFSTADPTFSSAQATYERLDERTYFNTKLNTPIHYFTEEEMRKWFSSYRLYSLVCSTLLDLGHGEPHYHGTIQLLSQKT